MRLGIITAWNDSGAGYVSRAYADVLSSKYEVFIYARGRPQPKSDPFWHSYRVHWAKWTYALTDVWELEFRNWLRVTRVDAVLFNEQRHWGAVRVARQLGVLTIAYVDYYRADTIQLFGLFDVLLCNTRRHYSVFANHPGAIYIPWGVDLNIFKHRPRAIAPGGIVRFLINAGRDGFYARDNPSLDRKGVGRMLAVLPRIAAPMEVVVASQAPLEECPEAWRRVVNSDPRVRFLVGTHKPPGLYEHGDVYVYPSRLDGIGLTLPEAVASGMPVLTTDEQPMNEFVRRGETGFLIAVERRTARDDGYYWPESIVNEQSLITGIMNFVEHPELVAKYSEASRVLASNELNWQQNARNLAAELLLRQRARSSRSEPKLERLSQVHDVRNYPRIRDEFRAPWRVTALLLGAALTKLIGRRG